MDMYQLTQAMSGKKAKIYPQTIPNEPIFTKIARTGQNQTKIAYKLPLQKALLNWPKKPKAEQPNPKWQMLAKSS